MPQPTRNKVPQPLTPANGQGPAKPAPGGDKGEPKILFQKYFKSVGPRTYAAQIKEATNGNHVLILTEGKRDPESDEVKKTKVFVFSEDFGTFFRMLHETAQWIRMNPVPEDIKRRRQRFWAKQNAAAEAGTPPAGGKTIAAPPPQARPVRRNGNTSSTPAAATSTKPLPVAAKAASVVTKPSLTSAKPGMNAPKPSLTSAKPGMNTPKPAVTAHKPVPSMTAKSSAKKSPPRRGR